MKIDRLLERTHTADCKRVRPTRADIAQVMGDEGVILNLAQSKVEVAVGGRGDDILIGGAANDVEWKVAA